MTDQTNQQKTKSEGLLSLLISIMKKSADLPEDVNLLATSLKLLADELKELSTCVTKLTKTILEHHIAINDLYLTQEMIIKTMKVYEDVGSADLIDVTPVKEKPPQKPN